MSHGISDSRSGAESRRPIRMDEASRELSLRTVVADRYLIIQAYGEIDIANAAELRGTIDSARVAGAGQLIMDLSGIRFMDSSGLNVLIATSRQLGSGSFAVVVSRPSIRRIFAVTGIDSVIPIFESVADAANALTRAAAVKDAHVFGSEVIPNPGDTCQAGSGKAELVLMADRTDLETAPTD